MKRRMLVFVRAQLVLERGDAILVRKVFGPGIVQVARAVLVPPFLGRLAFAFDLRSKIGLLGDVVHFLDFLGLGSCHLRFERNEEIRNLVNMEMAHVKQK